MSFACLQCHSAIIKCSVISRRRAGRSNTDSSLAFPGHLKISVTSKHAALRQMPTFVEHFMDREDSAEPDSLFVYSDKADLAAANAERDSI